MVLSVIDSFFSSREISRQTEKVECRRTILVQCQNSDHEDILVFKSAMKEAARHKYSQSMEMIVIPPVGPYKRNYQIEGARYAHAKSVPHPDKLPSIF